jgi:putative endonuclease
MKASVLETFHFTKTTKMDLVYIIHSATLNRFYIGYTSNFDLRLDFHLNSNEARKFTSKAKDWEIYFKIECETKTQALAIEKHIKQMKSKIYIENLIRYPEISIKLLEKYKDC